MGKRRGCHQDEERANDTTVSCGQRTEVSWFKWVMVSHRIFVLCSLHYCYKYENDTSMTLLVIFIQFSRSVMSNSATPWTAAHRASLFITNSQSLLKLMSIKSVTPSHHLILCHPLLLLPSVFLSIRVFSNESVFHMRWPKYWSFSFSISPSNEHPGLISFRMDWLDLLAVKGL